MKMSDGRNYCRCDAPDENGRRSECGLPGVQCKSCKDKDTIDALVEANKVMTQALQSLCDDSIDISSRVSGIAIEALICRDDILDKAKGQS